MANSDQTMGLLSRLSSARGDRTEYSNRKAALECLADPTLLREIAQGLTGAQPPLIGDCAEVMTMVAETRPELVKPYLKNLIPLLGHPTTRVRWEAMHAVALLAATAPAAIGPLLPQLGELVRSDPSVIVRDHAVDAIANYAGAGRTAAEKAYPYLIEALDTFDGKQAGHALAGLAQVAERAPQLRPDLRAVAARYARHPRGVVRQAAKTLEKVVEAEAR